MNLCALPHSAASPLAAPAHCSWVKILRGICGESSGYCESTYELDEFYYEDEPQGIWGEFGPPRDVTPHEKPPSPPPAAPSPGGTSGSSGGTSGSSGGASGSSGGTGPSPPPPPPPPPPPGDGGAAKPHRRLSAPTPTTPSHAPPSLDTVVQRLDDMALQLQEAKAAREGFAIVISVLCIIVVLEGVALRQLAVSRRSGPDPNPNPNPDCSCRPPITNGKPPTTSR